MIDVVAGILQNEYDEILIAKRRKEKHLGGYWEFPGGKVEAGEKFEEALIRELKEEMDIDICIDEYIGENYHKYPRGEVRLIAFKGRIINGDIHLTDHDEYQWVRIRDLTNFSLAPADIPFIDMIKDMHM